MGMSIPYELTGRTQQKSRTRSALVDATQRLIADGITPTVEEAAAAAAISRTTAYRYFPNQRSLLLAAHPEIETSSLLGEEPPDDPAARFSRVVEAFTDIVARTEPQQRAMLRLSLAPDALDHEQLFLRQGRAIGWLEDALAPLHGSVPEGALRRLVLATRAACGIESLVWLADVAGLTRGEALELQRWSARALFAATITESSG